jgi:hypothetical protein
MPCGCRGANRKPAVLDAAGAPYHTDDAGWVYVVTCQDGDHYYADETSAARAADDNGCEMIAYRA